MTGRRAASCQMITPREEGIEPRVMAQNCQMNAQSTRCTSVRKQSVASAAGKLCGREPQWRMGWNLTYTSEGMARAVAAVVPLAAAPGPGSLFENPTWWDLTCVENAG